jgi:phenylacetaldehyde dehydrogenase
MTVTLDRNVEEFIGVPRQLFIDGRWVDAASGRTFETPNPATGETLARIAEGGAEDINRAVKAARRAFEEGPWSRMTPSERGRIIWRIGDLILAHLDELAQLESLDNGKPFAVAQAADVPLAADLFHYMAGWATKIEGNSIDISVPYMPGANFHSYTLREPVGVVGQIIPWNFPLLMAAWKLGPALTTGNCVVLKPAEQTASTASAQASGPGISPRPTRWPRSSGPAPSGSTATTCSMRPCRSADTSSPAGAARWATRYSTATPRSRPSPPCCNTAG